jgi:hypothetical protein
MSAVAVAIGVGGLASAYAGNLASKRAGSNKFTSWNTPYSATTQGYTALDPTIRTSQDALYGQYGNLIPQVQNAQLQAGNSYQGLLTQAGQNSPAYVQSVIDPLQQRLSGQYGDMLIGQQQRGIRGSSFGDQQLMDFNEQAGRSVGDLTAQATNQSIGLQSGLTGNLLQSQLAGVQGQSALLGQQNTITQQNLAQELQSLGLSSDATGRMMQQMQLQNQAIAGGAYGLGQGLMGLGNVLAGQRGQGQSGIVPTGTYTGGNTSYGDYNPAATGSPNYGYYTNG